MVFYKDFLFVHQRFKNLINRRHATQVIYMELLWISGKLVYDKFFAVVYNKKVMNAKVFAEGLEKCRLLARVLGQDVEKLDNYDCTNSQDIAGERKTDNSWICSSYVF